MYNCQRPSNLAQIVKYDPPKDGWNHLVHAGNDTITIRSKKVWVGQSTTLKININNRGDQ